MNKADDFRQQADDAARRAQAASSPGQGARERRRAAAFRQLAENEDWLDGKSAAGTP